MQHFQAADFTQGKPHIVSKLRNMVAQRVTRFSPETLLEVVLNCRFQKVARIWRDSWDPELVLRQTGFDFLLEASTVVYVSAMEYERNSDFVVGYRRRAMDGEHFEQELVEDGTIKLEGLRAVLLDVFSTPGNMHWATQTDVAALADHLNMGFIVFASREQGNGHWMQGLNLERGNFPYWMLIYWEDPMHYRLGQLTCAGRPRTWFARADVPSAIEDHYNLCNGSSPMGRAPYGGIS